MITLKETLEKLKLDINIPKVQYNYPVLAYYESYEFKTIDGQKCVELKGHGCKGIPMVCVINLDNKQITEYNDHGKNDLNLLRSMDENGVMPFH